MLQKFSLFALGCQLSSLIYQLYVQYFKIRPWRKESDRLVAEMVAESERLKEELTRFLKRGPSMEQLQHMNVGMLAVMNGNRELFDHVVDDIEILHSLAYPNSASHPADCPVCISTLPALKRFCAMLATANIQLGPPESE